MPEIASRLEQPHNLAQSYHYWILDNPPIVPRDSTGRRNAAVKWTVEEQHQWINFRCNNSECPARLVAGLGSVLDVLRDTWPEPKQEATDGRV